MIADGHHRYETALTYQAERAPAGGDGAAATTTSSWRFVVELSEDQLSVGPIHRTLSRRRRRRSTWPSCFGRWFDTVHAGPADEQLVRRWPSRGPSPW